MDKNQVGLVTISDESLRRQPIVAFIAPIPPNSYSSAAFDS